MMSFPQSNMSLSLDDIPIVTSISEAYDTVLGLFSYFTSYSTTAMHPSDEGNYTCSATITHNLQKAVKVQLCGNATPPLYIHDCMPVVGVQHAPGALASCGDVRLVFTACCAGSNVHSPTCMSMNTSAKDLGVWLWLI